MTYRIKELAQLAGVSTRTLRYYDAIGLLKPERQRANGYRLYGEAQVNALQEILFYRELGFELEQIRQLMTAPAYSREASLRAHLAALREKQANIQALVQTVEKTIRAIEGEMTMSDEEKFEGFKKRLIHENDEKFGAEVTEKFGRAAVEESNRRLAGMTASQWAQQERLSEAIFKLLAEGMASGDPAGESAQAAADAHRQWLGLFWGEGAYSKESHLALAEGYVSDSRFTAFYDERLGDGAARFLRDAIAVYTRSE